MISRNRQQVRFLNVISDAVLVFVSYIIAMLLRYNVFNGIVSVDPYAAKFLVAIAVFSLIIPAFYYAFRPKTHAEGTGYEREYFVVVIVNAFGALAVMALFFIYRVTEFSRISIVMFWIISSFLVILKHVIGRRLILRYRSLGYSKRHVIVIGSGKSAEQYVKDTERIKTVDYVIDGFIGDVSKASVIGKHLGTFEDMESIIERCSPDELVAALEPDEIKYMPGIMSAADKDGLYISLIPFFNDYYPVHPEIESFGSSRLINLRATPLDNFALSLIKRAMDVIGSLVLIVLTGPLMLAAVIGVKLSSPGPVLFKQERVGKDKKNFNMLKFRSMRVNAEENTGWSKNSDPRRTKFGSFIRKYSIDELPQFFNVLKGDMSLVGPRPEIPFYVHQFRESVPLYLVRQQVRPGITGWAQVNGLRGDTSIEERVEYDIYYIENWSVWFDIKILLKTVFGGEFKNSEK